MVLEGRREKSDPKKALCWEGRMSHQWPVWPDHPNRNEAEAVSADAGEDTELHPSPAMLRAQ